VCGVAFVARLDRVPSHDTAARALAEFANEDSQSIAVIRGLGLDHEGVNVNRSTVGHSLGMSGARRVVALVHELRRRGGRYGLVGLGVGAGEGQVALFEIVEPAA
jgi:acetyl-CoA acetyltransferase